MSDITTLYRRVSKLVDDDLKTMNLFQRLILCNGSEFPETLIGLPDQDILKILEIVKQIDEEEAAEEPFGRDILS